MDEQSGHSLKLFRTQGGNKHPAVCVNKREMVLCILTPLSSASPGSSFSENLRRINPSGWITCHYCCLGCSRLSEKSMFKKSWIPIYDHYLPGPVNRSPHCNIISQERAQNLGHNLISITTTRTYLPQDCKRIFLTHVSCWDCFLSASLSPSKKTTMLKLKL